MRCPRCGNENPETNRFCGMCGATMLQGTVPLASIPRPVAPATPAVPKPSSTLPAKPSPPGVFEAPTAVVPGASSKGENAANELKREPRIEASKIDSGKSEVPVVSGPSFLGLNAPPARPSRGGNPLSIDPGSAPRSRNLDYLLEDDEPPKGSGGKVILILVALALAAGLGYLRWRNQGFGWLGSSGARSSSTAPDNNNSSTQPETNAPSPSASSSSPPATNPSGSPQPNASVPALASPTPGSAAAPASAPSATSGSAAPANMPATSAPTQSGNPAGSAVPAASAQPGANQSSPTKLPAKPSTAQASASNPTATSGDSGAANDSNGDASDSDETSATPAENPKPSADVRPARALDTVTEAQKYLYGRGVAQNCDRGLKLLKPAADRANPKAMAEMGALYSAGLCTPRDLPTAYRWFAMALRKDPDDQALQGDLEKLWGEMTQPERQQAMRLTQ